jgi:hypothetical protein
VPTRRWTSEERSSWAALQHSWQRERPELGVAHRNWVVVGSEFKDNFNSELGIQGDGGRVSRVKHASQGRYGLVVGGRAANAPALQAWSSRMARSPFNNTRQLPSAGDAGGTKFSGGIRGMNVRPERGVLGVERGDAQGAQYAMEAPPDVERERG